MTIDEAIAEERDNAKAQREIAEECFEEHIFDEKERIECLRYANESEQVAEWLEELKSYRALVFSGDITQKMLKEEYNKAIDDFTKKLKSECREHYVDCAGYFGGIKDSILYEDDIDELAEQLKAGANNGTDSQ